MQPREVASVMRQIKGGPVTILITMLMLGRGTGVSELMQCTGYAQKTVSRALDDLSFLGLAQQHSRYDGWMLTAKARQLPLMGPQPALEEDAPDDEDVIEAEAVEPRETEKIRLGSSSLTSSYSENQSPETDTETTKTNKLTRARAKTDGSETENLRLAVRHLAEAGVSKRTKHGKGALDAVEAARSGGWTGAQILEAVEGWLAYARSDAGATIKHAGYLTASRIADCEPPPEQLVLEELSQEERARQYIQEQYERIVER